MDIEQHILDYENTIKELEKLENERINLYKDLGEVNITEENKKNIDDKIDIQNAKINEETKKGIKASIELQKATLTPDQKARVNQIEQKNKPEIDAIEIMLSYPQLKTEFPEYDINDVKEFGKILQSSPKMDWNDARKIMTAVVNKREINEEEEKEKEEEVESSKFATPIMEAELDTSPVKPPSTEIILPVKEPIIKQPIIKQPIIKQPIIKQPITKPIITESEINNPKITKSIKPDISDINSFAKTIKPISGITETNLNTNTCPEILKASEIINSKFPYPSQFPNLTKIKSIELEPKIPEELKIPEDVKKGGKKSKSKKSKKSKKIKKNKTSKRN